MRNALVVAWKEFRTFFQTPIGWVILFIFTLLGGWFFFAVGKFFIQKQASMRSGLFDILPWLFLFYAPAVTMRLWAEEKRTGTVETLLTLPLKDWQIVAGKYLASVGLVAVWLLCLTPLAGVVAWFGDPDPGPILGGFIGALLLGAAYSAIGVAASALTENQIIALVVSVFGSFLFLLAGLDDVVALFPDALGGFLHELSLSNHFHSIARGVLDSRDLLFYVSFIAVFLAVNGWLVRRKLAGGLTAGLVAAIAIVANYLTSGTFFRIDLTENGRYTLSSDTERILGRLDDDLRLTAYLSSDVPVEFTNTRRDIEDLIREFESHTSHLKVEIVDPGKSDELKQQAEAAGIRAAQMNVADTDKLEVKLAYVGMVIEYQSVTEKLPFIPDTQTLEYDLVRRIAKMTRKGTPKVAWQVNDPFGGMNIPGMQRPPSQDRHSPTGDLAQMDAAIKSEYETTTVDLKSKVPDEVVALILCNSGAGLSDVQKFHLDQYLMRGGGLIVMAEGSEPLSFGGMGGGGGSPFMRSGAEKLPQDFFEHYGFKINKDVVIDLQCAQLPRRVPDFPLPVYVPYPAFPLVVGDSIDQEHPVSARFSDVVFLWPSSIDLLEDRLQSNGVKAHELVRSSQRAKRLEGFIDVSFEKLLDESNPESDPETFQQQYLLAALLEGQADRPYPSFFTARALPAELAKGDGAGAHSEDDGHGHGATPFEELLADPEVAPPPGEPIVPVPVEPKGDVPAPDEDDGAAGGTAPATSEETGGGGDGSVDGSGEDIPGGGLLRRQDASAGEPAPAPPAGAPAAEPQIEWLKNATAPLKVVVIGTSDFVGEGLVGGRMRNDLFLQSAIDYLSAESLSNLRAKRFQAASFEEPTDGAKRMAWALGFGGAPVLLAGLGVLTYLWRNAIRPAAARRRMAARGA